MDVSTGQVASGHFPFSAVEEREVGPREGFGRLSGPRVDALIGALGLLAPFALVETAILPQFDSVHNCGCYRVRVQVFGVVVEPMHHVVADHVAAVFDVVVGR